LGAAFAADFFATFIGPFVGAVAAFLTAGLDEVDFFVAAGFFATTFFAGFFTAGFFGTGFFTGAGFFTGFFTGCFALVALAPARTGLPFLAGGDFFAAAFFTTVAFFAAVFVAVRFAEDAAVVPLRALTLDGWAMWTYSWI
jgi:hypothetical protein